MNVKEYYRAHADAVEADRQASPFWLRRWVHETIHSRFDRHVAPGEVVLDAGCGEGHLSVRIAARGAFPIAIDLSYANVMSTRDRLRSASQGSRVVVADLENLPFLTGAVDLVVSSHAIEHLPNPDAGVRELARVSRGNLVVAMPTCLTPVALVVLGGDVFWKLTRRSPFAWLIGLTRVLVNLILRSDGPNEGYRGDRSLVHVWRFPSRVLDLLRRNDLEVLEVEAGPLAVPYLPNYSTLARRGQLLIDRLYRLPVVRYLGVGLHVTVRDADQRASGGEVIGPSATRHWN